jgi:hypothetical protein
MPMSDTDRETYAPFVLHEIDGESSLILEDAAFGAKEHIFAERADDGWSGNGYDWNSVIQVLVAEQLDSAAAEQLDYDPEGGTFAAYGPRGPLEQLAVVAAATYHDDAKLRDALSRAELD